MCRLGKKIKFTLIFNYHLSIAPFFSSDNCTETSIRLVDGRTGTEGRVEICYEGVWGSICPNYWKVENAMVACKQLGYATTGKKGPLYIYNLISTVLYIGATVSRLFGQSVRPVHYSYFTCSGNENKLIDCRHYVSSSCSYSYHAAIICEGKRQLLYSD